MGLQKALKYFGIQFDAGEFKSGFDAWEKKERQKKKKEMFQYSQLTNK